jgi:hypothetical protein
MLYMIAVLAVATVFGSGPATLAALASILAFLGEAISQPKPGRANSSPRAG